MELPVTDAEVGAFVKHLQTQGQQEIEEFIEDEKAQELARHRNGTTTITQDKS